MPRRHIPAFTLIELLVVIAVIGILATLAVTQLGSARVKARNAQAQSDISEMGKAVESFRNDDQAAEQVISNAPNLIDSLNGTTWSNSTSPFTGTQDTTALTYAASVTKTPSSAYIYRYIDSGSTPGASTRTLTKGASGVPVYSLCANIITSASPYYCATDGAGIGLSAGDQVAMTDGMVAWYKLDGTGTSTVAVDETGKGNDGTLNNFTFDGTSNGWTGGKLGKALIFNGNGDYVVNNTVSNLPTVQGNLTISLWVNYPTFGSRRIAISLVGSGRNSVDIELTSGSGIAAAIYGGSTLISAAAPSANVWHLITFTQDNGSTRLYVDGILASTAGTTSQSGPVGSLRIGSFNDAYPSPYWLGMLDDVRIYNRSLSSNEVQQLYSGTL